jgi:predicted metal-dependent hydrolase
MPKPDDSTVTREYQRGLSLGRAGAYFEAHEALEAAWRACATAERDFFQGLVHVVVSSYQRGRGREVATESQRHKALRRLAAYAPSYRGLDVGALLGALERAEPDLREYLVEGDPQPPIAVEEEQQPERDEGDA